MKRLFNNTLATLGDYFILVVLNLAATPILIKNFGVDGYGAFVFLSIFSIYGALSFFDLGMEGSLMNYVPRMLANDDRRRLQDTLSISLVYYGALGLLLAVALYYSAGFIASRLLDDTAALSRATVTASVSIIAAMIFVQFLTVPFTAVLQGMRRFVVTKGINIGMNILRYTLVVIAAVKYHRIDIAFMIIFGLTLLRLAVLLIIFIFLLPQFHRMRVHFDMKLLRTLFNYSSILFISRIIGLIYNQIDKILIWLYLAVASMTIYDVIARPAMLLRLTLGIITSAVIPEVAALHEAGDVEGIRKLYIRLVRFAYMMLLPILAILFVYIGDLLKLWVGSSFQRYSNLALILLAVYLVLPIPSVASTVVVGLEKVKQTIWIPIVSTVINLVLSIVLLQVIGLAGLLIATLCSHLFAMPFYLNRMMRFLDFKIKDLAPPLLYTALPAAVSYGINRVARQTLSEYIPVVIAIGLITYALNCLYSYRYLITAGEKNFLIERITRIRDRVIPDALNRWN
jgi:O-antigen/teichoic acid export membrane protein